MKIAIIYSTSTKTTKKACKILSGKLNADVQLIPIEMAKTECLLKYNFIILAVSSYNGKVQSIFKRYISHNIKNKLYYHQNYYADHDRPYDLCPVLNGERRSEVRAYRVKYGSSYREIPYDRA